MYFLLEPQTAECASHLLEKRLYHFIIYQKAIQAEMSMFLAVMSLGSLDTNKIQLVQGPLVTGNSAENSQSAGISGRYMTGPYLNSGPFPTQKELRHCPGFYLILHHEMKNMSPKRGEKTQTSYKKILIISSDNYILKTHPREIYHLKSDF